MHSTASERSCRIGVFCAWCYWNKVTGKQKRERARIVKFFEEHADEIPVVKMRKNSEGRWTRVTDGEQ